MKPSIHISLSAAVFGILTLMGPTQAEGASTAPRETPTFELAALKLGDMEQPALYYAEVTKGADGKDVTTYKPLEIGSGARPVSNTIPLTSPVRIFSGDHPLILIYHVAVCADEEGVAARCKRGADHGKQVALRDKSRGAVE